MDAEIPVRPEGTLLSDHIEREARAFRIAWGSAHSHDVYIRQVLNGVNRQVRRSVNR